MTVRLDKLTQSIFPTFPREQGRKRETCKSMKDLDDFIAKNSFYNECFVSVYGVDGVIDKLFFDFDFKEIKIHAGEGEILYKNIDPLPFAKKFYSYCYQNKYPIIPVITGKKGFHFYLMLRPDYYSKEDMRSACYSLMVNSGAYVKIEYGSSENKKVYFVPAADTTSFGDVRRLCRIPNTQRVKSSNWCSYLPEKWHTLSESKIYSYMKSPHNFTYKLSYLPTLDLLIDNVDEKFRSFGRKEDGKDIDFEIVTGEIKKFKEEDLKPIHKLIKPFLRPCIFEELILPNPRHFIRTAATIDMLKWDFFEDEIIEFWRKLGWRDFEYDYTAEQVNQIAETTFYRFSCDRLREKGAMCRSECKFFRRKK